MSQPNPRYIPPTPPVVEPLPAPDSCEAWLLTHGYIEYPDWRQIAEHRLLAEHCAESDIT